MILFIQRSITFDQPLAASTPAGADTEVGDIEGIGIGVADKRLLLALLSCGKVSTVPSAKQIIGIINM